MTARRRHVWLLTIIAWLALVLIGLASLSITPASAQANASPFTTGYRWDAQRRLVGRIDPDPATTGLTFQAERYSYDIDGQLSAIERGNLLAWQGDAVAPASWSGFSVREILNYTYDSAGNLVEERMTAGGAVQRVTQMTQDADDRLLCSAVRMNLAAIPTAGGNACALGTTGSDGPDRITRNVYDAASQILVVQQAYATDLAQDYATYTYTGNAQRKTISDANHNLATYDYDGFDRPIAWRFPSAANGLVSATCTVGPVTETGGIASPPTTHGFGDDCEKYGYDRNGNRALLMKRDGRVLSYAYDAVDRLRLKTVPNVCVITPPGCVAPPSAANRDVYFAYDRRGLQTAATFDSLTGQGVGSQYDLAGRLTRSSTTMGGVTRNLDYQYDADGNRTLLTFPDAQAFGYRYDGLDRMTAMVKGAGDVTNLYYDNAGRRSALNGGIASSYGYDAASRLSGVTHDLAGTAQDVTWWLLRYNAASQLMSRQLGNEAYAYGDRWNADRGYAVNGLNQYVQAGNRTPGYDANGNLSRFAGADYVYDAENRLVQANGAQAALLTYDPLGRLYEVSAGGVATRFVYDGDALVAEYDGASTMLRRYLHGPGVDDPLVWYEGGGIGDRRHLRADAQGSIVAVSDALGASLGIDSYDEYGNPAPQNIGRFQYTGQAWLPELQLYYYKARIYIPRLGRFAQTDPVGYQDQNNLYAYVANDPVNGRDPTGQETCVGSETACAAVYAGGQELRNTAAKTPEGSDLRRQAASFGPQGKGTTVLADPTTTKHAVFDATVNPEQGGTIVVGPTAIGEGAELLGGTLGHEQAHKSDHELNGELKTGEERMATERHGFTVENEYRAAKGWQPRDVEKDARTSFNASCTGLADAPSCK